MSFQPQLGEFDFWYLQGDNGPIHDRIHHSYEEAQQALEELKIKVPSIVNENVQILKKTIHRQMLTE